MIFKIMIPNERVVHQFLNEYNIANKTDFKLVEVHDWETTFGSIHTEKCGNDDILLMGIQFGKIMTKFRIEGKLNY